MSPAIRWQAGCMAKILGFEKEAAALAQEKAATELRLFLAGPFINPHRKPKKAKNKSNAAAILRHHLYNLLSVEHDVTLGEHKQLRKIYRKHLKQLHEAATAEALHAYNHTDAVILIPSSPGSFCELGLFSNLGEVCRKMLILLDKRFAKKPGYVHLGPARQAENYGAFVEQVSYEKLDDVRIIVRNFVDQQRIRKIVSKVRTS